jgi:myo-inositol 2-dehydrogenase/D-chiro-inositol 1-dehydrogenase
MVEPLGVLLLSFESYEGAHQRLMYAPAFARNRRCRLVAVADAGDAPVHVHDLNRHEAAALGLPYLHDLDSALMRDDVQIVSVCCGLPRRAALVDRIARSGKTLLIDKPMAGTIDDARAIAAAARRAGITAMPAHHYRFDRAIRAARKQVSEGRIGLPYAIHGEFLIATGRAVNEMGELRNFGCYPIDAIRAVTGCEVRQVYATTARGLVATASGGSAEDFAFLAMTLDHGIIATTSVARTGVQTHPRGYSGDRTLRIAGSHGTLLVDTHRPALWIYGPERAVERSFAGHALDAQIEHLVDCVLGRARPELDAGDGVAAVAVVETAYESARRGLALPVPGV